MAKLPSDADLGAIPSPHSSRPIATYDATGFAKGAAALASGAVDLGKGLQSAGKDVAAVALAEQKQAEQQALQDRLQAVRARSEMAVERVTLRNETSKEIPSAELPERHRNQLLAKSNALQEGFLSPEAGSAFAMANEADIAQAVAEVKAETEQRYGDVRLADWTTRGDGAIAQAVASLDEQARVRVINSFRDELDELARAYPAIQPRVPELQRKFVQDYSISAIRRLPPEQQVWALAGTQTANPEVELLAGKGLAPKPAPDGSAALTEFIPEDKRFAMLQDAATRTLEELRRNDANAELDRHNVRSTIVNDISSVGAGGAGDETLTRERVSSALGPVEAQRWQEGRADAHAAWTASFDFSTLPQAEIRARLEALRPKPEQSGDPFERQQAIHEVVRRRADEALALRAEDPAQSVADDPAVRQAEAGVKADDPSTLGALYAARLAAQKRAGIAEDAQSPITREEALHLTEPLRRMQPGEEGRVLAELGVGLKSLFGDNANKTLEYALRVHDLYRRQEIAAAQSALFPPAPSDYGGGPLTVPAMEATSATLAAGSKAPETFASIPLRAIQDLRANPERAEVFDARYGRGTSQKIFNNFPITILTTP